LGLNQRACELGLINRVVADGHQMETGLEMANIIAKWTPEFVSHTKRTFHRATALDMGKALDMSRDISVLMSRLPG